MKLLRAVKVASVLAMAGGLGLEATATRAQAPLPAPNPAPASAPAPAAMAAPTVRAIPRTTVAVRRPAVARNAIPRGATVGGRYRDWTANRPIPIAKPWLKAVP